MKGWNLPTYFIALYSDIESQRSLSSALPCQFNQEKIFHTGPEAILSHICSYLLLFSDAILTAVFSLLSRLSQSICFLASPHVTLTGGSQQALTPSCDFFYPFLNTPLALTHIGFLSCFSSLKLTNFHSFWPQESGHRSLLSFIYSVNGIVMLNLSYYYH